MWIADGSNFAGQSNLTRAFDRYLESMREIYAALPLDWRVFIEHKLYEPAFYSTVIADWGTSFAAALELGPQAQCLVDLGHHAPSVNIEQIVARLTRFGKLAGFHFNDSKYGDDDLDAGSIAPFRLFLVFNELVDAALREAAGFAPAYMIDQSHNVTDPIESLMQSAIELQRAYAQALIVDRAALEAAQAANDALGAHLELKRALLDRRLADPGDGAPALRRRHRADRDLPRLGLSSREGAGEAGGGRDFGGDRVADARSGARRERKAPAAESTDSSWPGLSRPSQGDCEAIVRTPSGCRFATWKAARSQPVPEAPNQLHRVDGRDIGRPKGRPSFDGLCPAMTAWGFRSFLP